MPASCLDTATTMLDMPTELWSRTVDNVDKDTLPSLSLTCRYLHSIAKPFIFRNFYLFHGLLSLRPRNISRLSFYASDAIAPHVREINVAIDCGFPRQELSETLTPFFNALPRFLSTRTLDFYAIDLTAPFLQQISALPSLQELRIAECPPPLHPDGLPMLRLRTFTCLWYKEHKTDRLGPHRWLALIDPKYLQVLHVPLISGTSSFFLANHLPPFPSLHTIHLTCHGAYGALPQFPMLLSKIPALRRLEVILFCFDYTKPFIPVVEALSSPRLSFVPLLEEYTGPHELLPVVLGREVASPSVHLKRLVLHSIPTPGDPLDGFMNTLKSRDPQQLKNLTHLHISLPKSMDFKSLTALQDMAPVLQELFIDGCISFHQGRLGYDVPFTDLYTLQLPPSLVSLSIQWKSVSATADLASLITAKDGLLSRLPSLCRLWLCDWFKSALLWSQNASGTEERCDHFEVVGSFNTAWKMRAALFPEDPPLVH